MSVPASVFPLQQGRFVFREAVYHQGVARLRYRVEGGAFQADFEEQVHFPGAPDELPPASSQACKQALKILHLIAGVSYYKANLAPEVVVETGPISVRLAQLLTAVYQQGLGEFSYQNRLPVTTQFHATERTPDDVPALGLAARVLVPIGGGKDSLVSIEALKQAQVSACATWIGNSELIRATALATGLPTLNIQRQVSTTLFELNRQGALNGHVPVTAINSAILVLAALLYDYHAVVFSNEASANAQTLTDAEGQAVNHQWSKSWAFEQAFADIVEHEVAADLRYYSLLRPYRELAITAKFAKFMQYDQLFSSCNRNFRILGEKPSSRWCGECPKCHFVFLALAPFVPKPRLIQIFGKNYLDDSVLIGAFDQLMEWNGEHKPFECVGESQESRAAFVALSARADWREDALVQRFSREIAPSLDAKALDIATLCQPELSSAAAPECRLLIDALI